MSRTAKVWILFGLCALRGGLGDIDIGLCRRPVLPVDRSRAGRAVLERRGELLEDFRELRKFRFARAHRRSAFAFVTRQAFEHNMKYVGKDHPPRCHVLGAPPCDDPTCYHMKTLRGYYAEPRDILLTVR